MKNKDKTYTFILEIIVILQLLYMKQASLSFSTILCRKANVEYNFIDSLFDIFENQNYNRNRNFGILRTET